MNAHLIDVTSKTVLSEITFQGQDVMCCFELIISQSAHWFRLKLNRSDTHLSESFHYVLKHYKMFF